jgi:hypothetical protein
LLYKEVSIRDRLEFSTTNFKIKHCLLYHNNQPTSFAEANLHLTEEESSMAADKDKIEMAPRVSGDENTGDDLKKGQTLLKSGLDELGYWDTVKLFWKVRFRAIEAFVQR